MFSIPSRTSEEAFFEVMRSSDLWSRFKKYMYPKDHSTNYYNYKDGDAAASNGYLFLIKESNQLTFSCFAVDLACRNGHLETAQYLYYYRSEGCTFNAINNAAENGHLEIVKWLLLTIRVSYDSYLMECATRSGNLELVQWLVDNHFVIYSHKLLSHAIKNIRILKYFDENYLVTYDEDMMICAVEGGNLDVITFLHDKYPDAEDCRLLVIAAYSGHLEVVKWIYENNLFETYNEIGSALNQAAVNGSLDIIIFLYGLFNNYDIDTLHDYMCDTIEIAVERGYLEIVKWIYNNIEDINIMGALEIAKEEGFIEIIEFLQGTI